MNRTPGNEPRDVQPLRGLLRNPQPLSGLDMPRFAGIATMMRLPLRESAQGLDACFVGVPFDIGTSNRPGARYGPRAIRSESVLVRPYNTATGAAPFETLVVADVGDVRINPYNLLRSVDMIEEEINEIVCVGCRPLILGGDHTILLPHLRAVAREHGKLGLVHVDAHADNVDEIYGEKVTHGTPIRRAIDEDLIDPRRVVQIGLRGGGYDPDDVRWGERVGFRITRAEELWHKSAAPLMDAVREHLGSGPVYVTFDIDALDIGIAPGTGTPEIGGLTSAQALEIVRGLRGLDLVGCDLVEVSPPYDLSGATALIAAYLLFEMLCVLPGVTHR
jgi:guanidinobutyrase